MDNRMYELVPYAYTIMHNELSKARGLAVKDSTDSIKENVTLLPQKDMYKIEEWVFQEQCKPGKKLSARISKPEAKNTAHRGTEYVEIEVNVEGHFIIKCPCLHREEFGVPCGRVLFMVFSFHRLKPNNVRHGSWDHFDKEMTDPKFWTSEYLAGLRAASRHNPSQYIPELPNEGFEQLLQDEISKHGALAMYPGQLASRANTSKQKKAATKLQRRYRPMAEKKIARAYRNESTPHGRSTGRGG